MRFNYKWAGLPKNKILINRINDAQRIGNDLDLAADYYIPEEIGLNT